MSAPTEPQRKPSSHNAIAVDDMADLIPDYLNGHLNASELAAFEEALASNSELQEQHRFERELQIAMREEARLADQAAAMANVPAGSGFAAIADQLDSSPRIGWLTALRHWWRGDGLKGGVPALALVMAISIVGGISLVSVEVPVNEFETRIDVEQHSQPTLRVLPRLDVKSADFSQLLADYDLQLKQLLPDSNMADVTVLVEGADLTELAIVVGNDARVLHAKVIVNNESE